MRRCSSIRTVIEQCNGTYYRTCTCAHTGLGAIYLIYWQGHKRARPRDQATTRIGLSKVSDIDGAIGDMYRHDIVDRHARQGNRIRYRRSTSSRRASKICISRHRCICTWCTCSFFFILRFQTRVDYILWPTLYPLQNELPLLGQPFISSISNYMY